MNTARLYVLAEKYDVEALRLDICGDLFNFVHLRVVFGEFLKPLCFAVVDYVYANTNRQSLIRKLIADWFTWFPQASWQGEGESTDWLYNVPEFAVDLALALDAPADKTKMGCIFEWDKSRYLGKLLKQE